MSPPALLDFKLSYAAKWSCLAVSYVHFYSLMAD